MERKKLDPNQIVTLNDYPVRNEQILKIYFRIFHGGQGKIVPPCPVIHKSLGIPLIPGRRDKVKRYNNLLIKFLERHPQTEYFLLDGTHKTTAAALSHKPISVMVFRSNQDIMEARKLIETGEIFSLTTGNSIKEVLEILRKHFFKTMIFQTVAEKTKKMVQNKAVPKYMIDVYNRGKK